MSGTRQPLITPENTPQIVPSGNLPLLPERATTLLRQGAAGVLTIPGATLDFLGMVANPNRTLRAITGQSTDADRDPYGGVAQVLSGTGQAANDIVAKAVGVQPNPTLQDDTTEALAKIAGQSIPTLGVGATRPLVQAAARSPTAVRAALRALEWITPTTVTSRTGLSTLRPMAANVGVQAAVGAGLERYIEPFDPTQPHKTYDQDGNLIDEYYPEPNNLPGSGRIAVNAVRDQVGDHPVLAGLGAAGALGAAVLTRRGLRTAKTIQDANATSDIVQPIPRVDENVPITNTPVTVAGVPVVPGAVREAANKTAEVLQDSNIQAKDAARQSNPGTAEAVRDAIDMANEGAHKDRVISLAETGRLNTPVGMRQSESIRRISEEVYHRSINDPEFQKKFNELIAMESELDNRAYQVDKGNANSVAIDVTTGQRVQSGVQGANVHWITPRATLHAIWDSDLITRIRDIRANEPEVVAMAERYWKLHRDLADAWVDFGILSKGERAAWRKANPHFMHTINFDDPKSPRTYRLREHEQGPPTAGDPFLAAIEYQDFMLGQVYRNRKNQELIESLRSTTGGSNIYNNGQWLGKVAHPAELRRTVIPVPGSNKPRNLTLDELDLKGDVITYFDKGELVRAEVKNKALYNTMQRMPQHATTIMGWFRQLAQSGMTGAWAMAVLQPFSMANATMGGMFASIVRPAGMSFGYLDKGLQAVTQRVLGKPIGLRGDPTAMLGMANSVGMDARAILARSISEAFYNSITGGGRLAGAADAAHGMWSKIPDAQGIADRAAKTFVESLYAENHRTGSGGATTLGTKEADTHGRASLISTVAPHSNLTRVVNNPQDLKERIQMFRRSIVPTDLKIATRLLLDLNEAVGNAAQTFFYRSNADKARAKGEAAVPVEQAYAQAMHQAQPYVDQAKAHRDNARVALQSAKVAKANGNTRLATQHRVYAKAEQQLAKAQQALADPHLATARTHRAAADAAWNEWFKEVQHLGVATRQLLGDPAQMGTGLRDLGKPGRTLPTVIAGNVTNWIPYGNIGWQAGARMIRAAKENPLGTAAALAMTLGPMVYLPLASALRKDQEAEARGEEPHAMKDELSRPAWEVTRFIPIPIDGVPPEHTPLFRIDPVLSFAYTLFREGVISAFGLRGDPRSDPTLAYTHEQLMRISEARSWNNIWTSALNALPFNQVPPVFGAASTMAGFNLGSFNELLGRGGATPMTTRNLGGFDQSRITNDVTTKTFDSVAGQLGGGAAMTLVQTIRSGYQHELREPGTFVPGALNTLRGKAIDRLPEIAPLFPGQARRLSTNDNLADMTNAKERLFNTIKDNTASVNMPGTIGSGRGAEIMRDGGGRGGTADAEMRGLLTRAAELGRTLQPLRDARTKERERLIHVEALGLSYADQRNQQNAISREIRRINANLLARYVEFEDNETQRTGYRIRLDNVDPRKPISQFDRILR